MTGLFMRAVVVISMLFAPLAAVAEESPLTVAGATTVSVDDAYTLFEEGAYFVDVRKPSDFETGRIPGALHLDIKTNFTEASLGEHVAVGDKVVIYCNGWSCMRSSEASEMAVGWGYQSVFYLRDGFPGWDAAGFPIE